MVSKSTDSGSKFKKLHGEQSRDGLANLSQKLYQLKKQIQSERLASIKERVENNRQKLESHVSELVPKIIERDRETNGGGNMLLSRMASPLNKFSGFAQGYGEKDYVNSHEVNSSSTTKLPYVEKLPPYTTWIFLDRNQRMAEDQSVVGRRRIYYDQHGSEALICSDSEDDIVEPEEEKHEFSEGEDRLLWLAIGENGAGDEVINVVRHFVGGTPLEIQERYKALKEKYHEKKGQDGNSSGEIDPDRGICLYKSLSAALDSFDNLFCRRCLHFDCRMHGCSQTLVYPTEKQPYWSEHEDNGKPCGVHCYLQRLQATSDLPGMSNSKASGIKQDERSISGEMMPAPAEATCSSQTDKETSTIGASILVMDEQVAAGKRKVLKQRDPVNCDSVCTDGDPQLSSKKQKTLDSLSAPNEATPLVNNVFYRKDTHLDCGSSNEDEAQMTNKQINTLENSEDIDQEYQKFNEFSSSLNSNKGQLDANSVNCDWKPVEKELYLKGLEIFGRNSCLIARNLLSGLRTCEEIFRYMHDGGTSIPNRSLAPNQCYLEDNRRADTECFEGETPTRTRLFRRRGKSRKIKYSWKSAGHPSIWKRIADGRNQSCKQYTPCGCQSMCGKQCPCLHNGTTCEKYCGCSKSCKNRFRGCHCAKSQCRSRQCPCFAAGRECDPDVCRNCWVSCGDSSLGEPPRRGDGQCGNMRLLLRQQQRILLARSDVAGWGAFLKNSVNKNDYLGEYTGELISHREADKRGKIYDRANSSFLFDLNDQYVLDAYRKGDKLKFANHSSNPNCYAKVMLVAGDHRVGIFAKERIEAGEELFYDYRYGPDQAPAWARKPEGSKRDDSAAYPGRAKKHQSH